MARGGPSKSNRALPEAGAAGGKKDTGLPQFFKARRLAPLPGAKDKTAQPQLSKTARRKLQAAKRHAAQNGTAMEMDDEAVDEERQRVDAVMDADFADLQSSLHALNAQLLAPRAPPRHEAAVPDADELDGFARAALDPALTGRKDSSSRAYMRELRKVLDLSDVLLEVLDARDPLGCRSLATERLALASGKRVVLVLNKIDLVPKANVEAWLKYLRHDFPVLAFKASTQSQRSHLSHSRAAAPTASGSSGSKISAGAEALGATALVQLLKAYAKRDAGRASLTVGVFGAPNVGKSSVVNSLVRSRACPVAATPGATKVVQGVVLDKGLRLLDCPGVVFLGPEDGSGALQALRNTIKVELVADPITPVQAILARVAPSQLEELYSIEGGFDEGDVQDFLMRVALLRGKLGRGGVPDIEGTARIVLHDWNMGKIAYYTQPPAVHASHGASSTAASGSAGGAAAASAPDGTAPTELDGSRIVSGFDAAFDLAALLGEADAEALGGGTGVGRTPAPAPPQRRYAALESEAAPLEEDTEPSLPAPPSPPAAASSSRTAKLGDASFTSSLGKRRRGMDADPLSDSESEDESAPSVRALTPLSDDEEELAASAATLAAAESSADPAVAAAAAAAATAAARAKEPEWKQRERAKAEGLAAAATKARGRTAELGAFFSAAEMAGLAESRGAARKRAKKAKKRDVQAGAGLVEDLEAAMNIGEPQAMQQQEEAQPKSKKNKKKKKAKAAPAPHGQGAFAALAGRTGDGIDDDEEL